MSNHSNPLEGVKVAAPCSAGWENMTGNDRVRFCQQCDLNVYNLSGMSRREAETLINNTESRLCIRFYRRADGTILTRDCPTGLRAIRRRVSRITTAVASAVLGFFTGVGFNYAFRPTHYVMGQYARPMPELDERYEPMVGVMAVDIERTPPKQKGEVRKGRRSGQ